MTLLLASVNVKHTVPLGADKMGHYKSEIFFIKTYDKQQFFSTKFCNTLILGGSTLRSSHHSHSPWHQGVEVEEVGGGEGTPVELVIFAYIMFVPS